MRPTFGLVTTPRKRRPWPRNRWSRWRNRWTRWRETGGHSAAKRAVTIARDTHPKRVGHHIECGDGNVVAWCAGHLLAAAPPEAYGAEYKTWSLAHLPIVPGDWKLEVAAPDLLKSIRHLLKGATRVVHAGDPDREGQLLVDEVLHFLGYAGPVDRILIRDLSPEGVRRALGALEPNAKYQPLSASALARQRADWLYGMNMTRLYTLLGRAAGYDGVLSVGRVQTPLLGLIVARDHAIASFRRTPYYVVTATMKTPAGVKFRATWTPGPAAQAHLDEEKRLLARDIAEAVRARIDGQPARVGTSSEDRKTQAPPLPYALATLQMDAGQRLGLSAHAVLDACQILYEARLTTYPRSDCAYLPEGHFAHAKDVVQSLVGNAPALASAASGADLSLRSKAWNDKKVSAHHAIVPTASARGAAASLSDRERAVYALVGRRYLAQFYPPFEFLQTRLELHVAGERFLARGRQILSPGWKALGADPAENETGAERGQPEGADEEAAPLPPLQTGDTVTVDAVAVLAHQTAPPKPFADASLIAAMCGIAKFVRDPRVQKILTEADGLGTPATRAAILETLLERGYVVREKKTIVSTPTGRALIQTLPAVATTPERTATWEAALCAITEGQQSREAFLARVGAELETLVRDGKALGSIRVGAVRPAGDRTAAASRVPRAQASRRSRAGPRAGKGPA